jgi:hypothetical protein
VSVCVPASVARRVDNCNVIVISMIWTDVKSYQGILRFKGYVHLCYISVYCSDLLKQFLV